MLTLVTNRRTIKVVLAIILIEVIKGNVAHDIESYS